MSCYLFDASKRKGIKPVVDGVVQETPKEIIKPITHVIRKGETLSSIAGKYKDVSYQEIAKANGIHNPNNIYVGQRITIPNQPKTPTPPPSKPTHRPLADSTSIGGSRGSGCECPPAKWMRIAKGEEGVQRYSVKRKRGFKLKGDNPRILKYHLSGGVRYGEKISWCGSFVNWVMKKAGYNTSKVGNPYWALNWRKFGKRISKPVYGAIGVKTRGKGGHVSFFVGKSKDGNYYYMLGGNQTTKSKVVIEEYPAKKWNRGFYVPLDYDATNCKTPIYTGQSVKGNGDPN